MVVGRAQHIIVIRGWKKVCCALYKFGSRDKMSVNALLLLFSFSAESSFACSEIRRVVVAKYVPFG